MTTATFTTVNDVIAHLIDLEPDFADLDTDTMREIVFNNRENRYEDLTEDEINAMYEAAMVAMNQ